MNNNKEDQFLSWLMGEKVPFPYFKNFPEVPQPDLRTLAERRNQEEPTNNPD